MAKRVDIIIKAIAIFSLFSTVTNFVPFSVTFVLIVFLLPFSRVYSNKSKLYLSLIALYAYFFISTVIYSPQALFSGSFYRRDGNFFVTFLPLLLLPLFKKTFLTRIVYLRFLYFSTFVSLACMILPRINLNPGDIIEIEEDISVNHFLFEAHNAVGGFIAVILSLIIGLWMTEKNKRERIKYAVCAMINVVALIDCGARGTLMAIVLSVAILILVRKQISKGKKKRFFDKLLFIIILISNIVIVAVCSDEKLYNYVLQLLHISNRTYAISVRLTDLWPRAINLFFSSPILGTGYGSFNDQPYNLVRILDGLFVFNKPAQYIFSDAHAHNTFLHVMAETGLVGLGLLLNVMNNMRNEIIKLKDKSLRYCLYIALSVNVYSSFTEHRFFTPSQMLPFLLVLGMAISKNRKTQDISSRGLANEYYYKRQISDT